MRRISNDVFIKITLILLFTGGNIVCCSAESADLLRVPTSFQAPGKTEKLASNNGQQISRRRILLALALAFPGLAVDTPLTFTLSTKTAASRQITAAEIPYKDPDWIIQLLGTLQHPLTNRDLPKKIRDFLIDIELSFNPIANRIEQIPVRNLDGNPNPDFLIQLIYVLREKNYHVYDTSKDVFRALVNDLAGQDITKIIDKSIPRDYQNEARRNIFSCAIIGHAVSILLNAYGFDNVLPAIVPGHIVPVFSLNGSRYFLIDVARGVIGNIDLARYYLPGRYASLKSKMPVTERLAALLKGPKHDVINLDTLSEEDKIALLTLYYPYIHIGGESAPTHGFPPYVHNNLGKLFKDAKMPEQAQSHFKIALKYDPFLAEAYNNIGNLYADLKKFEEAETAYHEALTIHPNYADALYNLAYTYEEHGRQYYNNAEQQRALQYFISAIEAYEQLIEMDPLYAEAYLQLGVLYLNLSGLDGTFSEKGLQCLKSFLKLNRQDLLKRQPREVRDLLEKLKISAVSSKEIGPDALAAVMLPLMPYFSFEKNALPEIRRTDNGI